MATKSVIAAKVQPIVARALADVPIAQRKEQMNRFLAALWDPRLPEAGLFIKAFGIDPNAATGIFDALKGLSFYQWSISGNNEPLFLTVRWLQSAQATPYDIRQYLHHKEAYDMFRKKVAYGIRDVGKIATTIFAEYDSAHARFIQSGDPKPFRQFLETAHKRYWMLGYSSTAISQISYLFNNTMLEAVRGRLSFDRAIEMLQLMNMSMLEKSGSPDQNVEMI
jgi:hypothetical protein